MTRGRVSATHDDIGDEMHVHQQLSRLLAAGVADAAGISAAAFTRYGHALCDVAGSVVAVSPALVPARRLATLLQRNAKSGFVVDDLTDLESFAPLPELDVPDQPLYLLHHPDRGTTCGTGVPTKLCPSSPLVDEHRSPSPKASAGCCRSRRSWSATTAS